MFTPLLVAVLLMAASFGDGCVLSDAESMTRCIRNLLETGRDTLNASIGHFRVNDVSEVNKSNIDWWITNMTVRGLAGYKIQQMNIVQTDDNAMLLEFNATWPLVEVSGSGRLRYCRDILGKATCFLLSGKPLAVLNDASGKLVSELELGLKDGKWHVTPRDTNIVIHFSDISVDVRLNGFLGFLDKFLGFPSRIYARKLTTVWWKKKKRVIENFVRDQIHSLLYKYVSPGLEKLLKFGS